MPGTAAPRLNRAFIAGVYCVAGLLMALPLTDALLALLPPHPLTLRWRFGAEGVLASNLLTPLFGWTLVLGLFLLRGHRRLLRTGAGLSLAVGALLLPLAALAGLDALQLHGQVKPAGLEAFDVAALVTLGKTTVIAVTLLLLGAGCWKSSRRHRSRGAETANDVVLAVPPSAIRVLEQR